MFKRLILTAAIALMAGFISISAQAADLITSPYGLGNISGFNLQGDILYLPSSGSFAVGAGTTLAVIYDTAELRGEYVEPIDDESARAGIGIGVNIPKLIGKLKGDWLLDNLNTSIGAVGLINLDGKVKIEPGFYLTLIKMGF